MYLSSEDSFRLNVLLANKPRAIRIDESKMVVYGLSDKGEAKVPLNPVGPPDPYLRKVKELISGHILGSPGGYPVYLRRWTRMGQMRDESLEQLLMLGEAEAVVAAVCSPGLTDELARRAWWAMEDADNARSMLTNPAIVQGTMGKVLAAWLVEFLPFETEADKMMESVRLVLQAGLIDDAQRADLWKKAGRKQAYQVGFLQGTPDHLPEPLPGRQLEGKDAQYLRQLSDEGNVCARLLERIYTPSGQTYAAIASGVLGKPPSQDVVTALFDALREYFADLRPEGDPDLPLDDLSAEAQCYANVEHAPDAVRECLDAVPAISNDVIAARLLSGLGYGVIRPVLRDSTAIGSLMRRKLAPIVAPIQRQLAVLLGN